MRDPAHRVQAPPAWPARVPESCVLGGGEARAMADDRVRDAYGIDLVTALGDPGAQFVNCVLMIHDDPPEEASARGDAFYIGSGPQIATPAQLVATHATAGAAAPHREVKLAHVDLVSGSAEELDLDPLAAVAVAQLDRTAVFIKPSIAPLHERDQGRKKFGSLLGEPITLPRPLTGLAVVLALKQPVLDELPETSRRRGLANADPVSEIVKAGGPIEGLPEEQEGGAGGDHLERPGDRAPVGVPAGARFQPAGHAQGVSHASDHS